MAFKLQKRAFLKLFLLLFIGLLPLFAGSATIEEIGEKKIRAAMRLIGHEILSAVGDSESRVMPIEKVHNEYKIPFEYDFEFEADVIISIVDSILNEKGISNDYLVEVEQCQSKDIVYSYVIGNAVNPNIVPCQGRHYPEDCYNLWITIVDNKSLVSSLDNTSELRSNANLFRSALVIFPLLFLFGLIGYYRKKKKPDNSDPNVVNIGQTKFDKRNMKLSINDGSTDLSSKEAELLSVLFASANEPIEREVILEKVWGDEGDYVGRTLDVFISKLRKKLESDSTVKIINIRGIGYKLVIDMPG